MKRIFRVIATLMFTFVIIVVYSKANSIKLVENEEEANLTIIISNSSSYHAINGKIYIDDKLYIDDYFSKDYKKCYKRTYYYISIPTGKHDIKVVTKRPNRTFEGSIEISKDKHWSFISCGDSCINFHFKDERFLFI